MFCTEQSKLGEWQHVDVVEGKKKCILAFGLVFEFDSSITEVKSVE